MKLLPHQEQMIKNMEKDAVMERTKEQVEGSVLYRFEVRYYEQDVPRIPSNRLRMFFWAKDYEHALEQFQDAEPTSISVVVINTGEEYVPGSV